MSPKPKKRTRYACFMHRIIKDRSSLLVKIRRWALMDLEIFELGFLVKKQTQLVMGRPSQRPEIESVL
jgi:hypothetical protein